MRTFSIIEVDNDYRAISGVKNMEFPSREKAEEWCANESWSGESYFVDREVVP